MQSTPQNITPSTLLFVVPEEEWRNLHATLEQIIDLITRRNADDSSSEWIESETARKLLGISPKTWQNYRDQRLIPFSQIGRKIYVNRAPPRYPPPPPPRRCKEHHLSLRLKKSLQWVMPNMFYNIFNDTPRHNPLPFQIFYVIMNCPYAVRLRMKPERGRYFYLTGFNLWIAIWRLMIFHLISNPLSYVEHMDTNR